MSSNNSTPKKTKEGGVSLANIITMIGLVLLAFFLYLGFSYSGTNFGTSILYALLITAGIGLLHYFMLQAKSVQNDFKKWRVVEYALVGVFVIACFATVPVMSQFINVNSDSANLKEYANNDLDNLESAISKFQDHERANLNQMSTRLYDVANAYNPHAAVTTELKDFISKEIMGGTNEILTPGAVEEFTNTWNEHIDNVYNRETTQNFAAAMAEKIQTNRDRINAWKVLEIPQAVDEITNLHQEIGKNLKEISDTYPLHQLGPNGSQIDILKAHEPFEISTESSFKDELAKRNGINAIGIGLSIVIFLLIVFNYVVAFRSTKVSVRPGSLDHDGGRILQV